MIFTRELTAPQVGITPRRLAAAERAIARAKVAAGLFAGQAPQERPEERLARFDAANAAEIERRRSEKAWLWRVARAFRRTLTAEERAAFNRYAAGMVDRGQPLRADRYCDVLRGFFGHYRWSLFRVTYHPERLRDWETRYYMREAGW